MCNDALVLVLVVGEPSPLLRIAETWLRSELEEKRSKGEEEPSSGAAALAEQDPTQLSFVAAGGYSAGRMAAYDIIGSR